MEVAPISVTSLGTDRGTQWKMTPQARSPHNLTQRPETGIEWPRAGTDFLCRATISLRRVTCEPNVVMTGLKPGNSSPTMSTRKLQWIELPPEETGRSQPMSEHDPQMIASLRTLIASSRPESGWSIS